PEEFVLIRIFTVEQRGEQVGDGPDAAAGQDGAREKAYEHPDDSHDARLKSRESKNQNAWPLRRRRRNGIRCAIARFRVGGHGGRRFGMDFAGKLPVAGRKVHYFQTTTRKAAPSLVDPRPPLSQTKYENNCPIVRAFAPMRNAENSGHPHCQFVAMLSQMRRGIHIAVALALALLLLRPFDCFAAMSTPKAMACCAKGKCLPTTDADECCKGALTSDQVA